MHLIWLTDIHLNFLELGERIEFYQKILKKKYDALLITGDIAEAPSIAPILHELVTHIKKPIYFVLGNHDYYLGQINDVHQEMRALTNTEPFLHWLPASGPQTLKEGITLIGQDGWADGRYGDYSQSHIGINDSRMIADLFQQKIISKTALLEKMQRLADTDAEHLSIDLQQAIGSPQCKKIIILTHVPPFKEACLHQGKISNDNWLPYFTSKAIGDVLMQVATKNPQISFLVLCGHTHSDAHYQPLNNLTIKAGGAEYYQPSMQSMEI